MTEKFLDKAYGASTPEETRDMYNDWAASYDAEVGDNGYACLLYTSPSPRDS